MAERASGKGPTGDKKSLPEIRQTLESNRDSADTI